MTPSPEHARLIAALGELRQAARLSLVGLAARTAFSKSSWERYFNGRTLPPRAAVQDLCRLAGEPAGRCLALWEIAEPVWSGRGAEAPRRDTPVPRPQPPDPSPAPEPGRTGRPGDRIATCVAVLACVCAVAVGGVAVALLLLPHHRDRPAASAPTSASPSPSGSGAYCRGSDCEGRSPMAMYCAAEPDTPARHRMAGGAWVELRYSKECRTSWARTWGTRVGDRIEVRAAGTGGRARGAGIKDGTDTDSFVYTPMVVTRPGTLVQACFRRAAKEGKQCFEGRVN